jgi:nitrite reductase (NO-forming)
MRAVGLAVLVALALPACRQAPPAAQHPAAPPQPPAAQQPAEQPSGTPPANVSHGEAPIGSAPAPAPVDPAPPPRSAKRVHHVRLEISHTNVTIAKGITYYAWTFGGTIPGPVIRVTQGDSIDFTLVNKAPQPHSMDFHAAEIAPSRYYVNVNPGDSLHYGFVAHVPGAFMYHCGTAPVAMHIANGMYGALIVDPATPRPQAKEVALVQSEFYLTPDDGKGGLRSLDWQKLLGLAPDHVVFNGRVAQYAEHPIEVKAGELIRLYVVNAGPNRFSSFHVVGGIFEKVFEDGSLDRPLRGVQTVNVPVGGGAIFEIRLRQPGDYPFVTHAFADATKGAVGIFRATGDAQP